MQPGNKQLFPEDLPAIKNIELIPIEKEYLKVLLLTRGIASLILIVLSVAGGIILWKDLPGWILVLAYSIVLVFIFLFIIFTRKVFAQKAYGIRERDILFRTGLIRRTVTIIPFNRVQHVEIKNGPIDRMFNLTILKVFTAGGSQSDLSIPGLRPETAQGIKELIVQKTSQDEEE